MTGPVPSALEEVRDVRMAQEDVHPNAGRDLHVFAFDVQVLRGVSVRGAVTACVYHELFSAASYLAVAASAIVLYFGAPFRRRG